eukprot:TRINITY_DN6761_c0_g1_i1.p2 TRINITY_DN6761_c0_g1~~TRINITY_DN6761_c0_g1_i1.p2  ORF type:complete len:268 (+),score=44.60 TRINITY_DN6761_c0_g1_i1:178-981(+)
MDTSVSQLVVDHPRQPGEPDDRPAPMKPSRWRQVLCAPQVDSDVWRQLYRHRVNGLHPPYDRYQLVSWVLLGLFSATFYTLVGPLLPEPYPTPATVMFTLLFLATLVTCGAATVSNAADPGLLHKLQGDLTYVRTPPGKQKCAKGCCAFVSHSSHHCRLCNKCVNGFDHHCRWINNCVGASNYRLFVVFLSVAVGTMLYQLGVSGVVLHAVWSGDERAEEEIRMKFDGMKDLVCVLLMASVTLELVAAALLVSLCAFHGVINFKGLR